MHFIQIQIRCEADFSDILIAELAELGFDSFEEFKSGFSGYILEESMDFEATKSMLEHYASITPLSYSLQKIEKENWNQKWESHYEPIVVDEQVLIKAPFHQISENYPFVLNIIPKMSFGTGHHPTTSQMVSFLLQYPPKEKEVIDAGSGTGILAIMAEKLGAKKVLAFDNDPWCIDNGNENLKTNGCEKTEMVLATTLKGLTENPVDVILANINKNVILPELENYSKSLVSEGFLFLSGFYTEDVTDIDFAASSLGLKLMDQKAKDNWACLLYKKMS
jgi:ribosomal protein L11 methyltransferase